MSAHLPQPEGKTRLALAIAGAVLCVWSIAYAVAAGGPLGLGVAAFGGWCGGIALLHLAASGRRRIEWVTHDDEGGASRLSNIERPILSPKGQWALFSILLVAGSWLLFQIPVGESGETLAVDASRFAIGWLATAVIVFALRKLIRATATAETLSSVSTPLGLLSLAIPVSALAAAALFLAPYDGGVTASVVGYVIAALVVVLILDSLFKPISRFLQPTSRRSPHAVPGTGFLFEISGPGGTGRFLDRFEELTGTRLEEVAGLRFLGRSFGPALGGGLALLWLSTSLTLVPLGSAGIRQHLGVLTTPELGPGIHLSLPRPFGNLFVLETGQVREIAVGFENDLLGPVLWNEQHFEDEENFLVGEGDEILTVNMPVLFRIAKPRDFLANTRDADTALRSLAEKELLRAISGRSLFDLIGPQREPIAARVHASLQQEVDRLGLGLEIVFVGLKDMHPPVQVSDSYQMVASAEEDRETYAQDAEAMAVTRLVAAAEKAHRLRALADRELAMRLSKAGGEASSFRALAEFDAEEAAILRDRLWHEALAESLAGKTKLILPAGRDVSVTIDHRNGTPSTTP